MPRKTQKKIIKKLDKRSVLTLAITALATTFIVSGVAVVLFFLMFAGKVYPGVSVLGIKLSGKTVKEVDALIEAQFAVKLPPLVELRFRDRFFLIPVSSVSASLNSQQTAVKIVNYGRQGSVLGNIQAIGQALVSGADFPVEIDLDKTALSQTVASIAAEIDIPLEEPTIYLAEEKASPIIEVTPGRNGRSVDVKNAQSQIITRLKHLSTEPINLKVEEVIVQIADEELIIAKQRAENLLKKTLTLTARDSSISLSGKELIPFILVKGGFNEDKVVNYLTELASKINQPSQDALFQFENNKVTTFRPSKTGLTLDIEKALPVLKEILINLEETDDERLTLALPVKETPPKVTTEEVNDLGIKQLLGKGISYFSGSASERIHNITLLSARLNGTLVAPGEVFSMAATVGDISSATGYKQAYIIKDGRTVLGDGGGTCQPSTTLFRAALNAGLPIVERHQHAYRVSYYEQGGSQPGLDAAIFLPQVDLKFKNDTPAYILIQALVDHDKKMVGFEIYGTKDNRQVYISPVRVWDQTPPPPPLYQDDPTLPQGVIKQVDFAAWGAKAAFDYRITKDGEIVQERTFFSNFRPWQAVYLRGTGG